MLNFSSKESAIQYLSSLNIFKEDINVLNHNTRLLKKDKDLFESLQNVSGIHNDNLLEILYNITHDNINKKCEVCGKDAPFHNYMKGYKKTCGNPLCQSTLRTLKSKQTKLEKYGDANYNNSAKNRQTKLDRYGDAYYSNREKGLNTKLLKYGDAHYNNTEKTRQTKLDRYGDASYNNKEKISEVKLSHFTNNEYKESVYNQVKQTKQERYGDENYNNGELNSLTQKENMKKKKAFYNSLFEGYLTECTPLFSFDDYIKIGFRDLNKSFKFKCNKCGEEFYGNLYANTHTNNQPRCPKCNPPLTQGFSLKEKQLRDYVSLIYKGEIIENSRKIIPPYELDIYLPEKNLAIEFNGNYWHSEELLKTRKVDVVNYHRNKTLLCRNKNIRLIHVFEYEWDENIEGLKKYINHLVNRKTLPITDFHLEEIEEDSFRNFKKENDFLAEEMYCSSTINFGLFVGKELYGGFSFQLLKENEYSFSFVEKYNCNIENYLPLILNYFEDTYKPKSILSNVDFSKEDESLFENLNFNFIENFPPKLKLLNSSLRIYDAGGSAWRRSS